MKKYVFIGAALLGVGCGNIEPNDAAIDARNQSGGRAHQLTIAHLTDPHIFDDKSKNVVPERADEGCLNLRLVDHAIAEINKQDAENEIDAVVVTGDLGVEKLIEAAGIECKRAKISLDPHGKLLFDGVSKDSEISEQINQRAHELASSLAKSQVNDWVFVNGNNDLCNEDVRTLRYFNSYLAQVALAVHTINQKIKIHNLVADADRVSTFVPAHAPNQVLIGFENGSFKNNHSAAYADGINKQNQASVIASLADEVALQEQKHKKIHLVFHAPNFDDPFNAGTAANECDKRIPTNAVFEENCTVVKPKIATNKVKNIYSAWLMPDALRTEWDKIASKASVKTLLAGHFHSQTREHYANPAAYQTEPYLNLEKYNVAPPISIKNQSVDPKVNQARGFSIVTFNHDGSRMVSFFWSNQTDNNTCQNVHLSPWIKQDA